MNHLPFIVAAYGLGIGAPGAMLIWCIVQMRRAERRTEGEERQ